MDKELQEILEELENNLSVSSLFGQNPNEDLINSCKKLLVYSGYKVIKPEIKGYKVENINDLINFFYIYKDTKHPEKYGSYRNKVDKDRRIAKLFVEARMSASGVNKRVALEECKNIIKTVFDYEDSFNFKRPVSFEAFGQVNCGWITEKALNIMRDQDMNVKERKAEELRKKAEQHYIETDSFDDFDDILEKMAKEGDNA